MAQDNSTFGELFKKYRLKSEFSTLSSFGNALANEGYVYEDSIYSHWQKNVRVPKDRKLLLVIIKIFVERGGIKTAVEANTLLASAGQGYLTHDELKPDKGNPQFIVNETAADNVLSFFMTTIKSKSIIRTGWTMFAIPHPESVAEHSYQLCVIAMVLADQLGVDREKLIKMAIIHDMGEIFTGDIVWVQGNIIDIEKRRKKEEIEAEGIEKIFKDTNKAEEYKSIFREMVERKSPEADIFWQLDKLEMAIQALKYEQTTGISLEEFFVSVNLHLTHPYLREVFSHVQKARPKRK
jgi:putative hydrolase of HD superfamily